jgi:hypothetical protein
MRRSTAVFVVTSFVVVTLAVIGSRAAGGAVSLGHPSMSWIGGPMRGAAPDAATCPASSCDDFSLAIDVPAASWKQNDGGVVVRIEWPDANDELDLHVYDPSGKEVAASVDLHTNAEQALIHAPARGTYLVHVVATHALNVVYTGRAWVARTNVRSAQTQRSSMRFAPPAFVDPQVWAGEPGVWAADDGAIYATAPWSLVQETSFVWRSRDGGRTFRIQPSRVPTGAVDPRMRPCTFGQGGGDSDVITDRTGRLYFADLWAVNSTIAVSTDGGDTWSCNPVAASSPEQDRPWLAPAPSADGDGPGVDAYLAYRDLAIGGLVPYAGEVAKPLQLHLDLTRDGGKTWKAASTYARGRVGTAGPIFTAGDGTIYQVYQYRSGVWLARSTDQGRTQRLFKVSERFGSPANYWVAGDVDRAGNLYVAWVEQGSWDVLYSVSRDRGVRWSKPLRVSPPASESSTFPWLAAGKAGDVAIAWYGSAGDHSPDNAPDATRWYAWVARSVNGASSSPRFEVAKMSETPVRFGELCDQGLTCGDRKMGDFFEIDIARDGSIVASFDDTARIQKTNDGYTPGPYVMVARQISGLGMARSAPASAELAGDAFPAEPAMSEEAAPLDLTALPRYQKLKGGFRLGLRLSSAADLTRALQASGVGIATDAYWLVMWKANDRVEYAGMHVDRNGRTSFFGGDAPGTVGRPDPLQPGLADKLAAYPATFTLNGGVDARTGQVFIDVPLGMFHLRPGDVLHSLQAFSMTSLLDRRTFLQPLYVVDSTPAQTVRIG